MSDVSFHPLNLGDTTDDDAQVIDSLVEQAPEPPSPPVTLIAGTPLIEEIIPTLLQSVHLSVDPAWSTPTVLIPADSRRKFLTIRVTSPSGTATDGVVFMSETRGPSGLGILYHGQSLPLDSHTGALLCIAVGAAAINVDVWSVTQ